MYSTKLKMLHSLLHIGLDPGGLCLPGSYHQKQELYRINLDFKDMNEKLKHWGIIKTDGGLWITVAFLIFSKNTALTTNP